MRYLDFVAVIHLLLASISCNMTLFNDLVTHILIQYNRPSTNRRNSEPLIKHCMEVASTFVSASNKRKEKKLNLSNKHISHCDLIVSRFKIKCAAKIR